ncbi:hypothetical protein N7492_001868 [Penicillium capsulatum]|uniref:SGNH hydrolase-type esterase domain-containing protein n=1 Tax=Penicillium capsulatum TaxID=69766 RepID=A0A9W9M1L6_9EURO|nr:hypothetical protein N7492_001868 [Penicillium capsulatum]KAJ6129084.1 hypothetical protein N7512_001864 [Penicillium capsulatum]
MSQRLHIASLGSSFAAGPGIPPQLEPVAAMRSGQNYPHLLARQLDAKLTDLTVSGATLLNITQEPQTPPLSAQVFPPQNEGLPGDVDIVTITAGGNDVNYIGQMIADAWRASTLGMVASTIMQGINAVSSMLTSGGSDVPPGASQEALVDRFVEVLDAVHAKAPASRIYLMEYLALMGSDTQPGVDIPLDGERIIYHTHVAHRLQEAYAATAARRSEWCECVAGHELSNNHALGSEEPWVGGYTLTSLLRRNVPVLHPTLKGMEAVADILVSSIQRHLQ